MGLHRQCDGLSRRDCLRMGVLGAGGLTLGSFLRWAQPAFGQHPVPTRDPGRSAIFIELPGGPSHLDSFDPKPEAPEGIRGSFSTIPTAVSGVRFSEHLPRLAAINDRFTVLRGVSHSLGAHPLGQKFINTGNRPIPALEYPAYGSVASTRLTTHEDLPACVAVPRSSQGPGYLGVRHAPLATNEVPRAGRPFQVRGISLGGGVTLEEIGKRKSLRDDLDRKFDAIAADDQLLSGLDQFNQRAYEMITSRRAREAFDVSKEPESFRSLFQDDPFSQSCLLAVRLIAAGVRFVTLSLGGWDTHNDNFTRLKDDLLPRLDSGLSSLFLGLEQKDLLSATTVFASGEFGRTPKINVRGTGGGRDHYPRCMFMLMGGGAIRGGQVVGESDATGAGPLHEGIKPEDVAATFYHSLGIDPKEEFQTPSGRPVAIVRDGEVLPQLLV